MEPGRSLTETFKDQWNAELDGAVRWAEQWRWGDVWAAMVAEAAIGRLGGDEAKRLIRGKPVH